MSKAAAAIRPALYYDSPVTGTKRTISYRELLDETATLGAVLHDLGVSAGDRVLIYMPMIPEAIVAMLACARIGAVHSVVFGGFAAKELATRIDDAEPKVVLTASCGVEPGRIVEYKPLLDLAIGLSKAKPESVVVFQRPQIEARMNETRDHDWTSLVEAAKAAGKRAPCADLAATDPLYILYTSGTTGVPKGVVRDIGGYIVALKWSMSAIYNVKPGDTYWAASDIGWVVGHSYIVYAPLLHGCASVLYEGKPIGTPDAGAFWRVIQDYKVTAFFTAPTAFRAVRKEDPQATLLKNYDISSMHTLVPGRRARRSRHRRLGREGARRAGGRSLVADRDRLGDRRQSGRPRHSADQARLADRADAGLRGRGRRRGLPSRCQSGTMGSIVVKLPLPPGCLPTLYRQDERMRESYLKEFPGYYKTADAGYVDEDGYLYIMGRTDDIINVAGHRLSTGGMEEVDRLASGRRRMRGARRQGRDQGRTALRLHRAEGRRRPAARGDREGSRQARARQDRPGRGVQDGLVVSRLPKTRSGKILRGTMKKIADHDPWATPATIEDPKALDEIKEALEARA